MKKNKKKEIFVNESLSLSKLTLDNVISFIDYKNRREEKNKDLQIKKSILRAQEKIGW
jgi:hypothetical protein